MVDGLLTTKEAAGRLGIEVTTLYTWLAESDAGEFVLRGESVTIDYLQGGPRGQGRIAIEAREIERLKELMRVRPRVRRTRPPVARRTGLTYITGPLGRPEDER